MANRVPLARWILGAAVTAWAVMFAVLATEHHRRFGTFAFDHGIFDQTMWLLSRGEGFNTVRGMHIWGHHGSVGLYLLVPFYWLGAGPPFLDVLQVAIVAAGAIPVFLLARDLLRSEWMALVPALAFLIHPSNQWFLREGFHPEVVAMTPLLFAVLAAHRRQWIRYGVLLAVSVSLKEDLALAAVMLGVILALRGHRKVGTWTAVGALAWMGFVSLVLIPHYSPEGDFYGQFYGDFGDTPAEVGWSAVTRPGDTWDRLDDADFLGYLRKIAGPLALLVVLAPLPLLMMVPQLFINLLSVQPFTWSTWYHYAAIPVVATTVATVESLGRIRQRSWRLVALSAVGLLALLTAAVMGLSPVAPRYGDGYWATNPNPRQALLEEAVGLPGADDPVSATYNLVPHLTQRGQIYMFPNPWRPHDWGVRGENLPDPDTVRWLVVDRLTLDDDESALLDRVLAEAWTIHLDREGMVVAERR